MHTVGRSEVETGFDGFVRKSSVRFLLWDFLFLPMSTLCFLPLQTNETTLPFFFVQTTRRLHGKVSCHYSARSILFFRPPRAVHGLKQTHTHTNHHLTTHQSKFVRARINGKVIRLTSASNTQPTAAPKVTDVLSHFLLRNKERDKLTD